jgi:hypothetical protein
VKVELKFSLSLIAIVIILVVMIAILRFLISNAMVNMDNIKNHDSMYSGAEPLSFT